MLPSEALVDIEHLYGQKETDANEEEHGCCGWNTNALDMKNGGKLVE